MPNEKRPYNKDQNIKDRPFKEYCLRVYVPPSDRAEFDAMIAKLMLEYNVRSVSAVIRLAIREAAVISGV